MLERFETLAEKAWFVGLLAVSVLAVLVAVASVRTEIGTPSPGFVLWQNLVAPAIDPISGASEALLLPHRTVLVSVDGEPVRDVAAVAARVGAVPPGTRLAYGFRRGSFAATVAIPTTRVTWRDVAPVYLPYLLEGIALLATALVIFLFRPRESAARAGVALGVVSGLMQVLALDLFAAAWLQRLYFVVESFVPAVLLHFALCFPEEKAFVRRHRWVLGAVYVACLPFAVLQNAFLLTDPERHLAVNDWVYTSAAAAGVASIAALVHGHRTARTALARAQVRIVLAGMAAAVVVPAVGLIAIIPLGVDVHMNTLTPFFVLYPVSIAYAVARHDLFHVDRWLRLGVVWATLSLVVFGSYAALVLAGEAWLGAGTRTPHVLVPLYVLAMLLVANPLRARIQRGVDRLFYRQGYSYRAAVETTSHALASVLDTDRIAVTVLATLTDVMAAEWAVLVVYGDAGEPPRLYARPAARATAADAALRGSETALASLQTFWSRHAAGGGELGERFARLGATLAFPLRFEERAVGVVLVGDKLSAAYYTDEDLDLVRTLVAQGALALVNAGAAEVIRRTQAELADAERLAAVGELAAAVAHGIRNPLAGIRTAAELARGGLRAEDGDLRESLDDIIGEADRLETRVRTILDFTRPLSLQVVPGDLEAFVRRFVDGFRTRVPSGVRVDAEVAPGLPPVPFDAGALGEVVETIAVNALEAMGPRGGAIVVRAAVDARHGTVSIVDSGPGMDAATRARVFDLFYTTKASGTGVGLAMAKRLVERQGGTLTVESAPGAGATFCIRLPIAASARNARTT